jgi:very-short-patch-repair endonuclease
MAHHTQNAVAIPGIPAPALVAGAAVWCHPYDRLFLWHHRLSSSTGTLRRCRPIAQTRDMSAETPREERRWRTSRAIRQQRALEVSGLHGGVAHRRDLRSQGLTRFDIASEVSAGRWRAAGRHTVVIGTEMTTEEARLWQAVWESGSGAVLDGISALLAAGLKGYTPDGIDVTMPANNRHHPVDGVRLHRRRAVGMTMTAGLPRVRPETATVRAARWARSDRQAALIVCLVVQQRLVPPHRILAAWTAQARKPRTSMVDQVIRDVCDGVQSLGELDFARLCREHGLPEPSRQVVRTLPGGRVYLDVAWEEIGLVVEIDGGHHALALSPIDDALRQNSVVLAGEPVLRIPVLGLRLAQDRFMAQVVEGHRMLRAA